MVVFNNPIDFLDIFRNMLREHELGSTQCSSQILHPARYTLCDTGFKIVRGNVTGVEDFGRETKSPWPSVGGNEGLVRGEPPGILF